MNRDLESGLDGGRESKLPPKWYDVPCQLLICKLHKTHFHNYVLITSYIGLMV